MEIAFLEWWKILLRGREWPPSGVVLFVVHRHLSQAAGQEKEKEGWPGRESKSYSPGAGEPTRSPFPFPTTALFGWFVVSLARCRLRYEVLCVSKPALTTGGSTSHSTTPTCLGSAANELPTRTALLREKNLFRRGRWSLSTDDPRTS